MRYLWGVNSPTPLTAAEFFKRDLPGFSKTDAHRQTQLAYSTVHDAAQTSPRARPETLRALQEWSLGAIAEHGVYISAAKTLGLSEPDATHPIPA